MRIGAAAAAATVACTAPYEPNDTSAASSSSTSDGTTTTGDASSEASTAVTSGGTGIQTVTSATNPGSDSTTGVDVCATQVAALAASIEAGQPCEVLVHLDDTAALLGFHVVCGATGTMWSAGKEIGDATECCGGTPTIYPAEEEAPFYVLHRVDPGGPDGVAVLSNHTGRVLFDATTGDGGPGTITVPEAWVDPDELAPALGCGDRGFSLESAQSYDLEQGGAAIGGADLSALAAAIGDTALAPALAASSSPAGSTLVVRYAPEDGGPAHALVLLEVTGS